MAVMTSQQRAELWADFMRELSAGRIVVGALTKAELRAAVDAIDQWCSDNAASFNSALPQPARAVLTANQKSRLLRAVVLKRENAGN